MCAQQGTKALLSSCKFALAICFCSLDNPAALTTESQCNSALPFAGASPAVKGLLVASHFDAGLGSPGASDAASCIGVMLEMARALAADGNSTLAAPVVFLFNGGEETLSQVGSSAAQHCITLQALSLHRLYCTSDDCT